MHNLAIASHRQPDRTAESISSQVFCWSRYGTESGEPIEQILHRKDIERSANAGTFLWGIGTSIRPSLRALLSLHSTPTIRFNAMLSPPQARDTTPGRVRVWHAGIGLDGARYVLPRGSVVTSRGDVKRGYHFALVCASGTPLEERDLTPVNPAQLRNLVGGTRVGASQVTAVVESRSERPQTGRSYRRGFDAQLVAPYLLTLTEYVDMDPPRNGRVDAVALAAVRAELFNEANAVDLRATYAFAGG